MHAFLKHQLGNPIKNRRPRLCTPAGNIAEFTSNSSKLRGDFLGQYSVVRQRDYRSDWLPVEKALGLLGLFTFEDAYCLVSQGRISVDGRPAVTGEFVSKTSKLELDKRPLPGRQELVYLLLNKPRHVLSTCEVGATATAGERRKRDEGGTVLDLVPAVPRVSPAGRLDYDSEGLLLLTNDGSLAHRVISPHYRLPKTYQVLIECARRSGRAPTPAALDALCLSGVTLQNGRTLRCRAARLLATGRAAGPAAGDGGGRSVVEVVLEEGQNREIRKMMSSQEGLGLVPTNGSAAEGGDSGPGRGEAAAPRVGSPPGGPGVRAAAAAARAAAGGAVWTGPGHPLRPGEHRRLSESEIRDLWEIQ